MAPGRLLARSWRLPQAGSADYTILSAGFAARSSVAMKTSVLEAEAVITPGMPGEAVRTIVTLLLFIHLFAVGLAIMTSSESIQSDRPGSSVGWSSMGDATGSLTWRMRIATGVSESLKGGLQKALEEGKGVPLSSVKLRAPVPRPGKILAMGGNFVRAVPRH